MDVPRDREGSFEPQLVRKRERRLTGFDDRILALYARGMSVWDIKGHLHEMCGVEVEFPRFRGQHDYAASAVGCVA